MLRGWRIVWLAGILLFARAASADTLPARNQALLLLRILAYDHNLGDRAAGGRVTIVVVYRAGNSDSEDAANGMAGTVQDIAKTTTIANYAITVVRIAYSDKTFDGDIARAHGAALYVAPGLGDSLATITGTTQARKVLSFSGVADYVSSGVAVGLAVDDGKPQILVNLPASRNEGADLDVALLRVAKIVKK